MNELLKKYLPFWDKLPAGDQNRLAANSYIKNVKKGEPVHSGESECLGLVVIMQGRLRVYASSAEGREVTLYRLFERDICLFSASCVMRNIDFDVFVQAEEDSELIVMSSVVYKELMSTSIHIASYTNEIMSSRFSEVMWVLDQIQNKKLDSRLAALLIEEYELSGGKITLTHEQLANHLGTAREVVTRMLKYFQSEGYITLGRGVIEIVDEAELRLAADESLR